MGNPQVGIETNYGTIVVEVDLERAPRTAGNFLWYVDQGFYTNGSFYRTVTMDNQPDDAIKIEVIQGGINPELHESRQPPIELERTTETGLRHLDGTISMGRFAPDSAHSEIFICIGDQPELDFGGKRNPDGQGFAAFGQLLSGMDVVRKIQTERASGQNLITPVTIHRIFRR